MGYSFWFPEFTDYMHAYVCFLHFQDENQMESVLKEVEKVNTDRGSNESWISISENKTRKVYPFKEVTALASGNSIVKAKKKSH